MLRERTPTAREHDRRRLDRCPSLEPVQVGSGLPVRGGADEPVDRVGRQHCQLPVTDRLDDAVDVRHGRRPSTTRSIPARSGVTRTSSKPSSSSSAAVGAAWPSPTSSASAPPGASTLADPRATASTAPSALSAACGSQSRTSGCNVARSAASTYGGFETTRSHGPAGRPSKRSWLASCTAMPVRETFSAASASASAELSIPVTRAPACSSAIASAIAPGAGADVEHPRRLAAGDQRQRPVDQDLRLGPRDQRPPVDREHQATEPPLAEHVLEWLAPRPPAHELPRASSSAAFSGRSNAM